MARGRSQMGAWGMLSLIAVLQVQLSSALPADPLRQYDRDVVTTTLTTCDEDQEPTPTKTVHEIDDGQVQVQDPLTSNTGQSSNVIYQIQDGQIQAPAPGYGPTTEQVVMATEVSSTSSTSSSSTSILSARDLTAPTTVAYDAATSSVTTSIPNSQLTSLSTSEVQSASSLSGATSTSGSVASSLNPSLQTSAQPFLTSVAGSSSSLSIVDTSTLASVQPTATSAVSQLSVSDIFKAASSASAEPIPSQIIQRTDHPVPRKGVQPQSRKLQTNKFYSAFYLEQQMSPAFTFPYSVAWCGGSTNAQNSWGIAISHTEQEQWAKSDGNWIKDAGQWSFFGAPVGIQFVILSASELIVSNNSYSSQSKPGLTTDSLEWGSVKVNLFAPGWQTPTITFPLVQGMPFITGEYHWATPFLQTTVGFRTLTYVGALPGNNTHKYRTVLYNNLEWLIYVTPSDPSYQANRFDLDSSGMAINGPSGFNGYIQVAKVPRTGSLDADIDPIKIYDASAGAYPTSVNITGSVADSTGTYSFSWTKGGDQSKPLLMFALPHQVESFDATTSNGLTRLQLNTTTKGVATAVTGHTWTLQESDLPLSMGFDPWKPGQTSYKRLTKEARDVVHQAAASELNQVIAQQSNTSSVYYDGKALAKFAALIYSIYGVVGNDNNVTLPNSKVSSAKALWQSGLLELQDAFATHVNNDWANGSTWDTGIRYPLEYESAWGGVVSVGTYVTGNPLEDFGSTYYNDHHFHYGYMVYAAAVIAYLDPTWLTNGTNKAFIDTLVRDYANPDCDDRHFPCHRMFDWWHGHSWAAGLFDSGDGKNQESSSEDTMASYAIKMWGQVTGDEAMQARGNLMLALQKRSMQKYYLYEASNTTNSSVLPSQFVGNKAAGILFENKIDHTTYFGAKREYIQGIHMIPILPFSAYIRSPGMVTQEWAAYFSAYTNSSVDDSNQAQLLGYETPYINLVAPSWKGLLMANYAICNETAARESYAYFSNSSLIANQLDGGASQTWYLAYTAYLTGGTIF